MFHLAAAFWALVVRLALFLAIYLLIFFSSQPFRMNRKQMNRTPGAISV
ncbi:hypothetical protein COLSTE_00212 [Collinsella stercoris DSM 13279]|uniref:Uncharacterized protein n=1 Tax=Collinsella stercoris DSM 13279 TaxID=445975 RepID=B6G822_9ACTN|nr:hypothetical protein COLSTE_00212 [Collinsella stercoris DSM 13279]